MKQEQPTVEMMTMILLVLKLEKSSDDYLRRSRPAMVRSWQALEPIGTSRVTCSLLMQPAQTVLDYANGETNSWHY